MKYYRLLLVLGLLTLPLFSIPLQNILMTPEQDAALSTQMDQSGSEQYSIEYFIRGFRIQIDHAYYYDLDSDGVFDDVYTIITIYSLSGYAEHVDADIYQYLTLPSGLTYYFLTVVTGCESSYCLHAEWFDVATEPGWYKLRATVANYDCYGISYDEDIVIFDPPETAPNSGTPRVCCVLH